MRAYVAYRNATGGVCGRQIGLKTADDGADNGRYRALLRTWRTRRCSASPGGFAAGDGGGVDVVTANKIPRWSPRSPTLPGRADRFDINPPFADVNAVIGKYQYLYEQGVRKAALVYIDAAVGRPRSTQAAAADGGGRASRSSTSRRSR